jgi:hypothetical protein
MPLDIAMLCGPTAICHVAAVCGAMFRATVMCGGTCVRRTTDRITAFRSQRQVLIAVRGVADMGFSCLIGLTMLGASLIFCAGVLGAMFGAIMGGSGFMDVTVLRMGFGPCVD